MRSPARAVLRPPDTPRPPPSVGRPPAITVGGPTPWVTGQTNLPRPGQNRRLTHPVGQRTDKRAVVEARPSLDPPRGSPGRPRQESGPGESVSPRPARHGLTVPRRWEEGPGAGGVRFGSALCYSSLG